MDEVDKADDNFKKYRELYHPEALEKNQLDELMVDAKVDHVNNAIRRAAVGSSSKRRKKATIMHQPGTTKVDRGSFEE
jgi:porphobilinogen deaminase